MTTDLARLAPAAERMFENAPVDWWRFVPCRTCNAPRQEPCMAWDMEARRSHVARVRSGLALHGTLWLIVNGFQADVVGVDA